MKTNSTQWIYYFPFFEKKMKNFSFTILFVICLFSSAFTNLTAQDFGVFIATAHRIDYPRTDGKENQIQELKDIVEEAHQKGINTLYFQVRGRGDAFYQSELEPWSESLTGSLGKNPGWDPLAELIELAKARNMKVIGWFNVFKIADKSNPTKSKSRIKHPAQAHPEWVLKSGSELFLNPGIPEVRKYIASVAEDLVSGYELDGIQLDFCRYPTTKYNDSKTVKKYKPLKQSTDDWRRENVTQTVRLIREAISAKNSDVILSAVPLGICKSVPKANGLQSYYEVYQDSYGWMENNLIDEVVPQIYWPIGNIPDGTGAKTSPDYETLCYAWKENSNGKPVKAGIALYKQPVFNQTQKQIEVAIQAGHSGVVFYAWLQFRKLNLDLNNFKYSASKVTKQQPDLTENKAHKFKYDKLTSNQILLYNDDNLTADSYEISDEYGNVKLNGKINGEHVVLLNIDSSMKIVRLKNNSGEKIAELNLH